MSASIYYVDERDDYIRAMDELQFPPAQKKKMVDEIMKRVECSRPKHQVEKNCFSKLEKE